jgi:hypothetical protein
MTDFIAKEQAAYPDIAQRYQKLKDLHVRKYVATFLRMLSRLHSSGPGRDGVLQTLSRTKTIRCGNFRLGCTMS